MISKLKNFFFYWIAVNKKCVMCKDLNRPLRNKRAYVLVTRGFFSHICTRSIYWRLQIILWHSWAVRRSLADFKQLCQLEKEIGLCLSCSLFSKFIGHSIYREYFYLIKELPHSCIAEAMFPVEETNPRCNIGNGFPIQRRRTAIFFRLLDRSRK